MKFTAVQLGGRVNYKKYITNRLKEIKGTTIEPYYATKLGSTSGVQVQRLTFLIGSRVENRCEFKHKTRSSA